MSTSGISSPFGGLSRSLGQVPHVLRTRSPLRLHHSRRSGWSPFDLHVLSTPPAFVLSQDQTLHRDFTTPRGWIDQCRAGSAWRPSQPASEQTLVVVRFKSGIAVSNDSAEAPSPTRAFEPSSVPFS